MARTDDITPFVRERVAIADAVRISGISKRTLQSLAWQGSIPGAAKPAGRWTFDINLLRNWAQQPPEKVVPCLRTSASETGSAGGDSRLPDAYTESLYKSVLSQRSAPRAKPSGR